MARTAYTPRHRRRRRRNRLNLPLLEGALVVVLVVMAVASITGGLGRMQTVSATAPSGDTSVPGNIREDGIPPVISGVQNRTVTAGEAVSWREGITVTDDRDTEPQLEVDASGVDLTLPGVYTVTYRATDAAGNVAEATALVTVVQKAEPSDQKKQALALAQDILDDILSPGMTQEEQVKAIYRWARGSMTYGGHIEPGDPYAAGYQMLTSYSGDCYGWFSATKVMFELLDIPNRDVEKVKLDPSDSSHYWSMVSVDGGKTWYHFDATPRVGDGDDFCLVTDAFLDAYSDANNHSHNRDKSLYPATPED